MNEFVYLGKAFSDDGRHYDSVELSLELARVPCGPLYGSHVTPADELNAFVAAWGNDPSLSKKLKVAMNTALPGPNIEP